MDENNNDNMFISDKELVLKKLSRKIFIGFLLGGVGLFSAFSVFKYQIDIEIFGLLLLWGGLLIGAIGSIIGWVGIIQIIIFLVKRK